MYAVVLAGCLMTAEQGLSAQTPAGGNGAGSGQSGQAADGQKPAAAQPSGAGSQGGANAFPEDTSSVPVLPSKGTPALPEGTYSGGGGGPDSGTAALPGDDADPVRSPDDARPVSDSAQELESTSRPADLDKLIQPPADDEPGKRKKRGDEADPKHQETSAEDLEVGKYYLEIKNWKGALSRFESALVLAPEEPEVFWGLAESEKNLGHFAEARAYYLKLLDYDPDGPHGKARSEEHT